MGWAEPIAEMVEKRSPMEWRAELATEKFPTSQAFGVVSGFLAHKTGSE